jgi:adenosylhomocysteine nucleosidase
MSKFGIISALPGELKPLVHDWQPFAWGIGQTAWRGRIGAVECVAVPGGMGKDAAARACEVAESASGGLDALVSLGWAGALSCGVFPARAYDVAEVIDAETGERFSPSLSTASPIKLVSLGHVARAEEKRPLGERHGAVLVDMEAASVARIAKEKGISFFCFKAVSDAYDELLPDFGNYTDDQGHLRVPALLAHVIFQPRYWPAMARLRKNTESGALALAAALRDFLEKHADYISE